MLPKIHRLKSQQDFSLVYQQGDRCKSSHMTLRKLKRQPVAQSHPTDPEQPSLPNRFGISVSQKVSKRAVIRNRIKRQIRAGLRQLLPQMSAGWDFVVIVHPQAVECDYWQFLRELEQLLIQAEVINGH